MVKSKKQLTKENKELKKHLKKIQDIIYDWCNSKNYVENTSWDSCNDELR